MQLSNIRTERFQRWIAGNKIFMTLIVLVFLASVTSEYFWTWNNIMNVFRQASVIGMIALGVHFVVLIGMLDLSVGSILVFSGAVILWGQNLFDLDIPGSFFLGAASGVVLGSLNGLIVTYGRVPSFITTLGTMFIYRYFMMWVADAGAVSGNRISHTFLGHGYWLGIPVVVFPLILAAVAAHVVLSRTLLGRYLYAVGQNSRAAFSSGANVRAVTIAAFAISGMAAGLGAVLETSRLNSISTANSGVYYELDAIAAVVLGGASLRGGKGTILGTVSGVLMFSILNNYMNLQNVSTYLQGVLKGLLIFLVLYRQNRLRED
ncbi:ABC transporter permease [Cohnella lupini]|uniref:Monosaccharide ABC transporter membrane protein (CUT2 family) n=1 Tax=Cohnella lupini TaxID=1294267 RepID=A0A3D9I446_9BACL|nr:ABC transporter permease [Cohnella lupini]RED56563.1 monosaccharide ABC transporter membrane protein (CUT2 family) [Cohnella lupini]